MAPTTSEEAAPAKPRREPRKKRQETEGAEEKAAPAKAEKSRGRELVYKPKAAAPANKEEASAPVEEVK